MKALCLAGGGPKGSFEVGVLTHLLKENPSLNYDIISGVSVGGLNAVFLASGPLDKTIPQLQDIWLNQVKGNHSVYVHRVWRKLFIFICIILFFAILTLMLFVFEVPKIITILSFITTLFLFYLPYKLLNLTESIYLTDPLRDLITKNLNIESLKQTTKKLIIGAVSYSTGEYRTIDKIDDNIIDWVMASSAYPLLFPMQFIDGEYWTDGGIVNLAPISDVVMAGATEIDVIITSPFNVDDYSKHTRPFGVVKQLIRNIDIISAKMLQNDVLIRCSSYGNIKVRVFMPEKQLSNGSLDFNPEKIEKMFEEGKRIAAKVLKK